MTLIVRNIDKPELSFQHNGVDQAYVNAAITYLSESSLYKLVIKVKATKAEQRYYTPRGQRKAS